MKPLIALLIAAAGAAAASSGSTAAPSPPTPLFSDSAMLRLTITGPVEEVARKGETSELARDAALTLQGPAPETHAITISARGITRRRRETCTFPPLRIDFAQKPASTSLFARQNRLKLVTHCRAGEFFQQHVLLEYAAYQMMNAITPLSFRARLATIDYVKPGAQQPYLTRLGFLIEDADDAARRNGLYEIDSGNVGLNQLNPAQAGRFAVFQYMIGNLDWSMQAGPPGDHCCHNSKLLAAAKEARTNLIPIPYDFDFSGFVDAPYATPPDQVPVATVRTRRYRGSCRHNAEALAAAAEIRSARPRVEAALSGVPQLDDKVRRKAMAYLSGFFDDIQTDEAVTRNLLRHCLR